MRIYKIKSGIVLEKEGKGYVLSDQNWDDFINDDYLSDKTEEIIQSSDPSPEFREIINIEQEAPVQGQEIWASGVTYYNSKLGRQEESENTGGGAFYAHVYEAPRPELFFKATASRTVGSGRGVRIREDSSWDVPEPELTLFVTSNKKIVGYTIGNDMSSRSIEGENPLYLPQAKTYDGCAGLGPCIYVSENPLDSNTMIEMIVERDEARVFEGRIGIDQMKRTPDELVGYLFRACTFPNGVFLMTGTGIVPTSDFTLNKGDKISIKIDPIGTLINTVE